MATREIQFRFNGQLIAGRVTAPQAADFVQVSQTVRLATAIASPADTVVQARINGVVQDQLFTLPAGLLFIEITVNGAGQQIPANALRDWQVVAAPSAFDLDIFETVTAPTAPLVGDADCGLGMLSEVKQHLLAVGLQSQPEYDRALSTIARGIAATFDRFCNRKFARQVNAQEYFTADRRHLYVARFPIESITSVELLTTTVDGWQLLPDAVFNRDDESGLIFLAAMQGWSWTQVRATFTGGYWYDQTGNGTGVLPTGARPVPDDLKLAWLTQTQHLWENRDNLGVGLTDKPGARSKLNDVQIVPAVREILRGYIRYMLT